MKILSDERGLSRTRLIAVVAVVALGIAAYFLFVASPQKRAQSDLLTYIDAVQKKDFNTIFDYNSTAQRRWLIIMRRSEPESAKDQEIKDLYNELKTSFDDATALETTDLRGIWSEKFLFVPGADMKISGAEMVLDKENPSQPATKRSNALVYVDANYPDKNTAPMIGRAKLKSVTYTVTMVFSKNVLRALRGEVTAIGKKWLFYSIEMKPGTAKYWQ